MAVANEAPSSGVVSDTVGATESTKNVTAVLSVTRPRLSECSACTVYVPSSSVTVVVCHVPELIATLSV